MRKPLWVPPAELIDKANITRFINFVNRTCGLDIRSYGDLYRWSVERIPEFWASVWDFVEIKASRRYDKVVDDLTKFPGTDWFPGARLNFAENLLRFRDDHPAFVFRGEDRKSATMTYAELFDSVARLSKALRNMGIVAGDRVAAYMPNLMETAIAMLAATSIGAVWSSCGTELGARAVADRLGQIGPKVLFTVDAQLYKGKAVNVLSNVEKIAKEIPSLEKIIVVPFVEQRPEIGNLGNAVLLPDFMSKDAPEIQFEQLPFNHPDLHHVFLRDDRKTQVHGPGTRRSHKSAKGTHDPYGPQARGQDFLHHFAKLDDVELADRIAWLSARPLCSMTAIPTIPTGARCGSSPRRRRSASSGAAPAI